MRRRAVLGTALAALAHPALVRPAGTDVAMPQFAIMFGHRFSVERGNQINRPTHTGFLTGPPLV